MKYLTLILLIFLLRPKSTRLFTDEIVNLAHDINSYAEVDTQDLPKSVKGQLIEFARKMYLYTRQIEREG